MRPSSSSAAPPRDAATGSAWPEPPKRQRETVSLEDETSNTLEEARVVLPGVQTIFGFQLIAVLNERFESLLDAQRTTHLCALVLVAVAMALVMAPAAWHRIAERGQVSREFIDLASRFIAIALVPLMIGITLDVFVIAWVVARHAVIAGVIAAALGATFAVLWFLLPWSRRRRMNAPAGRS